MSGPRVGPSVVRKRLGAELRKLRFTAGLRIEDVATDLECSTAKISRLESGLGTPKTWDVRNLLTLYGVTDQRKISRLVGWAGQGKEFGWWEPDADLAHDDLDRYLALETEASRFFAYCTPTFPAIIQTERYARALLEAAYLDLDESDINRLVALRVARQSILDREPDPLRPIIVADESVLYRVVGSREILDEQLRATLGHIDQRHVELRIFPLSSGAPGPAVSPFVIFEPRIADADPIVAQVESSTGEKWLEDPDEIAALRALLVSLTTRALTPGESRELISRAVN